MKISFLRAALCTTLFVSSAQAHDIRTNSTSRPDDHAPIGVMRDHVHKKGEYMLSYRYSFMDMQQNKDGSSDVSDANVLQSFNVAPTNMSMRMHMVGGMYALTDQFTVGAMGGFATTSMDHLRRNGTSFETEGVGFTDTRVNGMYEFYNDGAHRMQANFGVSLPTGSYDEIGANGLHLPYVMQLGSGTYDLLPGVSYSGHASNISWGGQANATIRTGTNNHGYRLGNNYNLTAWSAYKLNRAFSVSARLDGNMWSDIEGADPQFTRIMAPTMNPTLFAGRRLDALLGANFIVPEGTLAGHRLAVEFGTPIYEHLDQDRLGTDYRFTLGWQKAF